MITRKVAELALSEALKRGGDFAELFCEDTLLNGMTMINGAVDAASTSRKHGAGIRVYQGTNSLYVHTNDTSLEGLMKLAATAADAIGQTRQAQAQAPVASYALNVHKIERAPLSISGSTRADMLRRATKAAQAMSTEIAQVYAVLNDAESDVLIANSEGLFVPDRRVYTRFAVQTVASTGTENQIGSFAPGAMMGYELYATRVDVEECAQKAAQQAVTMLHAENCPAGVMPVAIDGGFGGVIFHEACGHSLEATSVAMGNSEFCGMLGTQIASPIVTAIDDGTMPNEWGSINIDDEGTPATRLVLIENGILKNYMIDRLNSRKMNMPVTGSARRQDYTYAPTSRMRNTFIAPGQDDEAEIIATMGDGLYAKNMGGGSVDPVTGQFNFSVSEGYLVKDGKIDRPVRGATLIGKGGEILKKIDRVGKKMWMAQGMCGSISGSVRTNVGQPMIRVTGITVGGK